MIPLAVQLFSLRHAGSLDDQFELVCAAGLEEVELHAPEFDDPTATARALSRHGLTARTAHAGLDLLADAETIVDSAQKLGLSDLVVWGFVERDLGPDPAAWEQRGRLLGDHANSLAEQGLRLSFHNHDWELRELPGGHGLDVLFEAAGEALGWQADLAWIARGGADVPAMLTRHASRLRSIHLKDLSGAQPTDEEEGWADLGHGILPWRKWADQIMRSHPAYLVLEHDAPSDFPRFLSRSAAMAQRLFSEASTS